MNTDSAAAPLSNAAAAAVSYLRVSTKEQAERDGDPEGYSIPAQRDANRRKAEQLGAVIAEEFVDRGESARSAARPELQRMLAYLQEHPEIRYVIVHKVDRLARNRLDDVEINLALKRAGVQLISASENIDETPSGMLLHGIMSSIAEFYSQNLAAEVIKGMDQKVKTGGTPGKPPLGYLNVRAVNSEGREVRTIDLDPERAQLIRWAFEEYATGNWSLVGLAEELNLRGLTNLPTPKYPARPLRANHLYTLLTHPYYKGDVLWRGVRYDGRHPRLVDEATWRAVQDTLAARGPGEKQREHRHYLKSSVFCSGCESRLIITQAKNRYGRIYPYFVCVGRHQKRTACTRKAILISQVEDAIEDYWAGVELPVELRGQVETLLTHELQAAQTKAETHNQQLLVRKQQLTHEQTKLLQAHYAGAVPLQLMKSEQDRITSQLEIVESQLQATTSEFATVKVNLTRALDFASNCYQAYRRADDATRRLLNQAFFTRILVNDEGVTAQLAEPLQTLLGPEVTRLAQGRQPETELDQERDETKPREGVDARTNGTDSWDLAYIQLICNGAKTQTNVRTVFPLPQV